jgi:hypothetical protein
MAKIKLSHREDMWKYLRGHEKYVAGNLREGWAAFACKLKLPGDLCADDLREWGIAALLADFDASQAHCTADINGDSPKLLVPYQKGATAKKHCYACGLWTQHKEDRPCTEYGCLGTLTSPIVQHSTIPFFNVTTDALIEEFRMVTRAVLALDELAEKCNKLFAPTRASGRVA